jgi:cytosine/adenosine deaminase-related metal-dependent hydrolase
MAINLCGEPSDDGRPLVLRARVVLPVNGPPIENGALLVYRDRIVVAGSWEDFPVQFKSLAGGKILDLGEVILMPGLVNAHCHLDYTGMAGIWPPPKKFIDWIPRMLAAKAEWSYSDYARSWIRGAKMLVQSGTTTVADIEAAPELLPDVWDSTPLRVISFLELTGVRSKREPSEILADSLEKITSVPHFRCATALSPHAPYSTTPELLSLCAEAAREKKLRLAVHVAESEQEYEMFAYARGEMFDWLKKNGRDNSDCGIGTPLQHLERAGLVGDNLLAIHANYLDVGDYGLLASRKVSVVHCPRSHEYFQHRKFPLDRLLEAKVNVCLGTDSLATITKNDKEEINLDMFLEMQALARTNPEVQAQTILKMATTNGACALGMAGKIGELSGGAFADLVMLPFSGAISDVYSMVVNYSGKISAAMIDGRWIYQRES